MNRVTDTTDRIGNSRRPTAGRSLISRLALPLLSFVALSGATTLSAQEDWTSVELPNASDAHFYAIEFVDSMQGVITGWDGADKGIFYATTDGGTTWQRSDAPGHVFTRTAFVSSETGVGYGYDIDDCQCAVIAQTTDGGATWETTQRTDLAAAHGLKRINDQSFLLSASNTGYKKTILLRSDDQGKTWKEIGTEVPPVGFVVQQIIDDMNWIGTSGGTMYRTTDAGETWTAGPIGNLGNVGRAKSLQFVNDQTGFVAAGANGPVPVIYRTTDGGSSWEVVYTSASYPYEMNTVYFATPSLGFAVAGDGAIVKTIDGGTTWEEVSMPQVNQFTAVNQRLYGVGGNGTLLFRSAKPDQSEAPHVVSNFSELEFGQTLLGESQSKTIEISNDGGAPLEVTGISLASENSGFTITSMPNLPLSFKPGLYVEVSVEFAPTEIATAETELQITTNDPENPVLSIPLTGIGTDKLTSVAERTKVRSGLLTIGPNPVVGTGRLTLTLPQSSAVMIEIYDVLGTKVMTRFDGALPTGVSGFDIDGNRLESGMYFCVVRTNHGEEAVSFFVP